MYGKYQGFVSRFEYASKAITNLQRNLSNLAREYIQSLGCSESVAYLDDKSDDRIRIHVKRERDDLIFQTSATIKIKELANLSIRFRFVLSVSEIGLDEATCHVTVNGIDAYNKGFKIIGDERGADIIFEDVHNAIDKCIDKYIFQLIETGRWKDGLFEPLY